MRTLEIPVKFQKGDTIYTTKQTKVEMTCHVCEGTGKIKYNEKHMKCPECMGAGKFQSNKQKHIICDDSYVISTTKISINNNGDASIKYKGYCGYTALNRAEDNLFFTREEAQARCDELNKEKTFIRIENIIISDCFKLTEPSIDKIQNKLEYYKVNKKFDKNIVVDKEGVLQDGYINYLLCKLLNIDVVKVVVE
jgi:DnaJ-class molecular chaperone